MSGFTNSDGENLARVATALERLATASEVRNSMILAEAVERREAWARSEAQTAEVVKSIREGERLQEGAT